MGWEQEVEKNVKWKNNAVLLAPYFNISSLSFQLRLIFDYIVFVVGALVTGLADSLYVFTVSW